MELILNLVWLLTTAGIFAAFGVWTAHQPKGATAASRHRFQIGLALVCVAALLFPIISMTDDLATTVVALEEWSAVRRAALLAFAFIHDLSLVGTTAVAPIFARVIRSVCLACAGLVSITILSILSPSTATVWSFRAPPFLQ